MNRMREQGGFGLIEVIVSAAVLALAALAVLSGIEGSQASTMREKSRSVAATLAEQDQEQLRSQQFDTLVGYTTSPPAARVVNVDGITYNVKSSAGWYTDSPTGTNNCTSSSSNANYLKISSVVTSSVVGTRIAPVQVDSLVSPSVQYSASHGSLGVKVVNAANAGVPDVAVTASGPASLGGTTDANGCVVFQNIAIGTYTVTLNKIGYVDHWGKQTVTLPDQEVAAGSVTVASASYDVASTVNATVETYPPNATGITPTLPSVATNVSAVNGNGEVGLLRTYAPTTPPAGGSFTADQLFPFTTKYQFFTGSCDYNNPYPGITDYWTKTPTRPGQVAAVPTPPQSTTVRQPPLFVNITKNSSGTLKSTSAQMTVTATPILPAGEDCTADQPITLKTQKWNSGIGSTNQYGWVGRSLQSGYPEAGVPFGHYQLCFQDGGKNYTYPDYDATAEYKGSATIISSPTWTTGTC
jgi:type II secretory pathway pseudopilin PulG